MDFLMSRENDVQQLRGQLAVMRSLWDYEREQILEVLELEINPRAWSTADLVEEIRDCIEGHRMLAGVPRIAPVSLPAKAPIRGEVSREEVEDWLNDLPLFGT
jgi:hypothetical protein